MKNTIFFYCFTFFWVCLFAVQGYSQCTGNMSVLVKEDFGGNSASPLSGPGLGPGVTTYTYESLAMINDGHYGIRKTSADLITGAKQFNSWHIGNDHTGSGYMMVVNADYTTGKFYETTVNNLCAGSKLYFSAWIANLIPLGQSDPLDPIIRFEISSALTGSLLASYVTPTVPRYNTFTWDQYGLNFILPPGESSVVLRIFNNQVGGIGNDLCLDDIEFSLCGSAMKPAITGVYQNSSDVCVGTPVSMSGNVDLTDYINPVFQWQFKSSTGSWAHIPGATTPNFSISNVQLSNSGFYRLLVAESGMINSVNCRSVSPLIPINVYAPSMPLLQAKTLICEKDTLGISATTNALQYTWQKGPTILPSTGNKFIIPSATLSDGGIYTLNIVTAGGCRSTNMITMVVLRNNLQRTLSPDTLLCDAQTLDINVQQPSANSYLWNDGSTLSQRRLAGAGTYTLLTGDGVCKRVDSFTITRNFTPAAKLGADTSLCYSETVTLNAANPLAEFYLWNNNSTDSILTVTNAGTYSVTVGNKCGATADDITITYKDCNNVFFVPNAFTPNNDGLNDLLSVKSYFRFEEFSFTIYNRWGQQVFSCNSLLAGWDGKFKGQLAEQGNYVWAIQYKRNGKTYRQKGNVLLLY